MFLITGGAGGLGSGVTRLALSQGAQVVVPFRQEAEAERLQGSVPAEHLPRLRFIPADLTDEATVISLIKAMPRLDALIHLVGGLLDGEHSRLRLPRLEAGF